LLGSGATAFMDNEPRFGGEDDPGASGKNVLKHNR
jgi:hypothetical protein